MSAKDLPLGVLKATPEDFIVQELVGNPPEAVPFSDETRIQGWDGKSALTVFQMSKRNAEHLAAFKEVARQLGVPFNFVSSHGMKDKGACTTQLVGVRGKFQPGFSHQDICLVQLTPQESKSVALDKLGKLRRGGMGGNRFNILIRTTVTELDLAPAMSTPNVFGPQRLKRPGSEQVGRLFLEGKYQEAIKLLLTTPGRDEFLKVKKLAGGSDESALAHPDFQHSFEFEIHKWQSFLWNKLLQEKVKELGAGVPAKLPLWNSNQQVAELYRHLWDPPYLNPRVLRMVALSERPSTLKPTNFQAKREAEGWRFTFDLPSGAYATVILSQLFKLEEKDAHSWPAKVAEPKDDAEEWFWSPEEVRKRKERGELIKRMMLGQWD